MTIADVGPNQVSVSITMDAGFSVKLEGGDIAFNGPSGLSLSSVSGLSADGNSGLAFQSLNTTKNMSKFGSYSYDFSNVKGQPNGVVSADNVTFILTGAGSLTASQFTGVVIHFCVASGSNCPNTGYASGSPETTVVPEPGSLGLMGTGLVGLGGLIRRRLLSKTI